MSWIERFRRAWDAEYLGPPTIETKVAAVPPVAPPILPQRSRFRVESAEGNTRVIDLKTGEDLSSHCIRVEFVHDAKVGYPELKITLRDNWDPGALIEGTADR